MTFLAWGRRGSWLTWEESFSRNKNSKYLHQILHCKWGLNFYNQRHLIALKDWYSFHPGTDLCIFFCQALKLLDITLLLYSGCKWHCKWLKVQGTSILKPPYTVREVQCRQYKWKSIFVSWSQIWKASIHEIIPWHMDIQSIQSAAIVREFTGMTM